MRPARAGSIHSGWGRAERAERPRRVGRLGQAPAVGSGGSSRRETMREGWSRAAAPGVKRRDGSASGTAHGPSALSFATGLLVGASGAPGAPQGASQTHGPRASAGIVVG